MWLGSPVVELSFAGPVDVRGKLFFALMIEDFIFAKLDVHTAINLRCRELVLLEPERENRFDAGLIVIGDGRICALTA